MLEAVGKLQQLCEEILIFTQNVLKLNKILLNVNYYKLILFVVLLP
jgi:hypothetical protein